MCFEQEQKERQKNESTEFIVFWARKEEEIYPLFEHLKDDKQQHFRMSILKSKNSKHLLYTDNEKNAWWRHSRTEERLALALRLVHQNEYCCIICFLHHHWVDWRYPKGSNILINDFCGCPRGGQKKLNLGRSPTGHQDMAYVHSHMPCHAVALKICFQSGRIQQGHGMC